MLIKPFPTILSALTAVLFLFVSTLLAEVPYQLKPSLAVNNSVRYGKAAWYSQKDPGVKRHTANNEIFNDNALTCAIRDVPFNQRIRVTNLANGKSIIVRVNDRGPHKRLIRQGRVIDLTKTAFAQIASLEKGLIKIRLEFL